MWYQKAVKAKLKIAKLYEYYMLTLDTERMRGTLPRSIFLYFMHGNSLDYKKAAFLYANLLTYEEGGEEMFLEYREQMFSFTMDQLMKRHITEPLRILYKRFCTEEEMTSEHMEAMRDICHAYMVSTKVPNMKCVLVIESDGSVKQKVPYNEDEGAIIYLYDKESRIVWESIEGRHYTDSIPYETKRLFYEPRFLEMCKKYGATLGKWKETDEKEEPTFENLQIKGIEFFEEQEVFRLCSRRIREDNYAEDEFLTYLCFELFRRQQYDKVTLMYLANYFCGATADMEALWKVSRDYGIPSHKLSERIITQMLFSEDMFEEEKIFEDYYLSDNVYFRLKQAYLAYTARQYVLFGRELNRCVFDIIANECEKKEELPDICKVALLSYFSDRYYSADMASVLHMVLREMCEKQIVLPFYLKYKSAWLREVQLHDKCMVSYQAEPGSRVKIFYKIRRAGRESLGYQTETLFPVCENIYVKQFVLYADEEVNYYFEEIRENDSVSTEKAKFRNHRRKREGKYGKLNAMIRMSPARRKQAMLDFEEEELMAQKLFKMY